MSRAFGRRAWTTIRAELIHVNDLTAEEHTRAQSRDALIWPVSDLFERGGLPPEDVEEIALMCGGSRSEFHWQPDSAQRYVKQAVARGELIALRRDTPPSDVTWHRPALRPRADDLSHAYRRAARAKKSATLTPGKIEVVGGFQLESTREDDGPSPDGNDGQTAYEIRVHADWRSVFHEDDAFVTVTFRVELVHMTIVFYGGAKASSPHDRHGTLGQHEQRHVDMARRWWTTANLRAIADQENFKMEYVLPRRYSRSEVNDAIEPQRLAIQAYLVARHQQEQENALDHTTQPRPAFEGDRR